METKLEKIAKLEKELAYKITEYEKKIAKLKNESYVLIQVVPDCGGGFRDRTTEIAISKDFRTLIGYCEVEFSYSPSLTDERPESDKEPCMTWYKVVKTNLEILN